MIDILAINLMYIMIAIPASPTTVYCSWVPVTKPDTVAPTGGQLRDHLEHDVNVA